MEHHDEAEEVEVGDGPPHRASAEADGEAEGKRPDRSPVSGGERGDQAIVGEVRRVDCAEADPPDCEARRQQAER